MLVLSRKIREQIEITTPSGDVIVITLCKIEENKVRIGVAAPTEYEIMRTELRERIGAK